MVGGVEAGVGHVEPIAFEDVRFGVIDVETSGLSPKRHRILQIGLVVVLADGTVVDRWSTYVRPRWWRVARVGPTNVHGITRSTLRTAPSLGDALDELSPRLDGVVLTAHNLGFDRAFLKRSAQRAKRNVRFERGVCTLQLSRSLDPDRQTSHRLADVCERYGIALTNAHDALADAEATAAVIPHLLRATGLTTVAELVQVGRR
jgi:DNA polymerase III subunit epsilon